MTRKTSTLYAVALSNGLESYGSDRAEAERIFHECAAVGRCFLVAIVRCERTYLAASIMRDDSATLGAFEAAVFRARERA